jgi:hypothetical protein
LKHVSRPLTPSTVAAIALFATSARAQPEPLVVELDYRVPSGCPDAAEFEAQVLGRTARVRFADLPPSDHLWTVTIVETTAGTSGSLRVGGAEQSELERKVVAATCEQVVMALALVAALSVDPEARISDSEPQAQVPAPRKPVRPAPEKPEAPPPQTRLLAGLTLTARGGVSPELAWAPRPHAGIAFRSRSGATWGLRLSAMRAHEHAATNAGEADLDWNIARLELFPLRLELGSLRLDPALFFEAGELRARGAGVTPVAEVHRPVLIVGALGRLSLLAFGVLAFELEAGPLVPLVRDRFYVQENSTVFRAPALTGFAAAGLSIEFL